MIAYNYTANISFVKRYEVYLLWWWFEGTYIITENLDKLFKRRFIYGRI